ncbi:hypothetical protein F5Y06DRAFT_282732 [Hypoxylon sp. FL0890]|nr:hypothetical protein F5Y06DRAFT_282732 [Hypoxylon sp. FL0890]
MEEPKVLPPEIILLFCEELAARRDFGTLFNCCLTNRAVASIACQQMYSNHELSVASTSVEPHGLSALRGLWRSIVLSSSGKTAFPYCTYIRTLSFGNFIECVDVYGFRQGLQKSMPEIGIGTLGQVGSLDIAINCVNSIMDYIKKYADDNEKAVALARIDGDRIPRYALHSWITQLRFLTSLRIVDGSVLGLEAGKAISKHCPNFAEVTCYSCISSSADEDFGAFLSALRPNSLRTFTIHSTNKMAKKSFTGLNTHATSLRNLKLGTQGRPAMKALDSLADCTALERLSIKNDRFSIAHLKAYNKETLDKVVSWISNCKSLKDLRLRQVRNALPIVEGVLKSPNIRLQSLAIIDFGKKGGGEDYAEDNATWATLGSQDQLEVLTLGLRNGRRMSLQIHRIPTLANSICQLKNLTCLCLSDAWITESEVQRFAAALPKLSEFGFNGDKVTDAIWESLGALSQLKMLSITSISAFTYGGLNQFCRRLTDTPGHERFALTIENQLPQVHDFEFEIPQLQAFLRDNLGGAIRIHYFRNYEPPEWDGEGDFDG